MNKTDTKEPMTIDSKSGKVLPTRNKKIDLSTVNDVRLEMANVYRGMKSGSIEASDGTKLVYVLGAIGKMIEAGDIKQIESAKNIDSQNVNLHDAREKLMGRLKTAIANQTANQIVERLQEI